MTSRSLPICLAIAAATALAGLAPASMAAPPVGMAAPMADFEAMPNVWFVQLKGTPTGSASSKKAVLSEQKAFRDAATALGIKYRERYAFDSLFNGLSIQTDASQLGKLYRIPGVKAIYPVDVIRLAESTPSEPELWTALNMIGATIAQTELGYTGRGIKVGVMDTGIDVDHPAFGGNGVARDQQPAFPAARVSNTAGTSSAMPSTRIRLLPPTTPLPSRTPIPMIAAVTARTWPGSSAPTAEVKGVAPDVTFGAYRVFGCAGSTFADIMIAAMERALADGMHVLNMSIGSAYQWPQYPTAMAATRLVNKGVVVVASIGNSGPTACIRRVRPGWARR